tara:strand:+ start:3400 stop:3807 length:408 start_codon:yes stop_codon:yes gene_type:complete
MIRKIVREEVAMSIQEVITELKQPVNAIGKQLPKKKIVEKTNYTNNTVLNDILNETKQAIESNKESEEYPMMGNGVYDSNRMNDVMSSQYGNMMDTNQSNADIIVGNNAPEATKKLFDKDFSGILKKSLEKSSNR